ncbi:NAD-binding protein [Aestuariibaculum marinum]|uniref:NAD-binding protein n=1 Tax=Aestuariibaculum marinum TaxID=2683592 RepID=UPI00293BF852|nr:NAD-binding protein [Aestuariibaculum marinum]
MDANKTLSEQAESKGFKCIHGNVLEEATLLEASAKDFRTFIALTENTEINLLASQLANDNFYVPEKYVVISPNENNEGAGVNLLGAASTLFASRTDIKPWIEKIQSSNYNEVETKITKETTTRLWVKSQLQKNNQVLPLVILDINGNKRPFGYNDTLEANEIVIYIE